MDGWIRLGLWDQCSSLERVSPSDIGLQLQEVWGGESDRRHKRRQENAARRGTALGRH